MVYSRSLSEFKLRSGTKTMGNKDNQLRTLLLEAKVVDEKTVNDLSAYAKNAHISLKQVIIEKGILSDKKLGKIIATSLSLPFIEVSKTVIPPEIFKIIPEKVARIHKIIVFGIENN